MIQTVTSSFSSALIALLAALPRLLLAILALCITILLARRLGDAIIPLLRRARVTPNARGIISSTIRFAIIAFGILLALHLVGLSSLVYSALASLGIVGLVVSFALQDITKQFASGILLLLNRPFEIGDQISVGSHKGEVVDLQLRVTVLRTETGQHILIPNAEVYTSALIIHPPAQA